MRRFSLPFPLLIAALANGFSFAMCAAFGGPFGQGPPDQVATHARTARASGALVALSTLSTRSGVARPWPLRQARCGQEGEGSGPTDAHAPLTVNVQRRAASAALVPPFTPTDGRDFERVSAAPADSGTTGSCGDVAPPAP